MTPAERDVVQRLLTLFDAACDEREALRAERDRYLEALKGQPVIKSEWEQLVAERDRLRKALGELFSPLHALTYILPPSPEARLKWHDEAIAIIDRALAGEEPAKS